MKKINLDEYSWNVVVRQATFDDIEEIIAMQVVCFPGMQPLNREQLESQMTRFPEGQICIEIDGKLAASSSSLMLDYDPRTQWHDHRKVADGGFIRNHNRRGDTLI